MSYSRENLGLLLGALGVAVFAGSLPATRMAVMGLDPWFITAARAAIAGLISIVILAVTARRLPSPAQWRGILVASLCLVLGFPLLSVFAMQTVPAAHGGVVLGILPLTTAACAALVAGERPSIGFWFAALFGAGLVVAFALRRSAGEIVAGDLWLLASIATAGLGYTYGGKLSRDMPGWQVIAWMLVAALPFSLVGTIYTWPAAPSEVPRSAWIALGYVALFSQLIGFVFWNAGLAMGGIARVGQVQLLQPFGVVALAALVNGETIDAETLIFAVAVVATVLVGQRMRVRKAAS